MPGRADMRCVALLYHHIGPARPGAYPELTISSELFARQIEWLARHGYTGICAADWLAWLATGTELPPKPILITFDDAYADIAEHALPLLRHHGFSATVFVVTARVGRTNTWDERQGYATLPLMTAEQIRSWAAEGIEFGAHSRTHADLTTLSADALAEEIVGSRDELERLLGAPVTSFAYPFGAFNDAARALVASSYGLAFSCLEGFNRAHTDRQLLRRVFLKPRHSMGMFALIVRLGGLQRFRDWRIRLALRTRLKRVLGVGARPSR